MTDVQKATAIVASTIRNIQPDFWSGARDMVGHKVNVHYDDGEYAATVNYETTSWCDYDMVDKLNDLLEEERLPFNVAYLSDYEVALERV